MTSHGTPRNVALLNYPGAQLAALYGLKDMFEVANSFASGHGAGLLVPHVVDVIEGNTEVCPAALIKLETCAAIIAPPSLQQEKYRGHNALHHWMAAQHDKGAVLSSACAGAFLLAASGRLNGRPATTHWALSRQFGENFPEVHLKTDQLIIDDGDIITAGGVMAWTDLGLRIVERFMGPSIMLQLAHQLLIEPGGREQRFYKTFLPELQHGDGAILKVQHWLQTAYSDSLTVSEMAERAGLTARTFLRRFHRDTGHKPNTYLQMVRVEKARSQLELSSRPVDEIAWSVGYQDPAAFRKVFQKVIGLSPGEYRKRFSPAGAMKRSEA
ncbi:helix-turn-helix domain-containing protein [Pseudovibrio exalbescens]|uniref:GlxA family transcriptional regulator n=1 Tax=Pseudovibrio exalbescens TaxID=197461 RepID=UPI002365F8D2|nr:helix-turn-helix domain-containing protein [Pseudovibrio exalbescens]MDD7912034.1 helix-turn-helix domain-containing protein [Pseudovibrio exalbescens]